VKGIKIIDGESFYEKIAEKLLVERSPKLAYLFRRLSEIKGHPVY
jgi:hypothetical protein